MVFGEFRLDLRRRLLLRASTGEPLGLTPRVLDTLIYLVQRPGKLLTRDALMDSIWPDAYVEPNNLSQNVAKLRRLLGETPGQNRFIETVPGRGYRFIAEVSAESPPAAPLERRPQAGARQERQFRQALRLLQRATADNCRRASELLHALLEVEPHFALAWAWLADAHLLAVNVGYANPEALDEAERAATRALELDPRTAVAHAVIGTIRCHRGDWLGAESHFMTAVALDGADPMPRALHASFLLQQIGHSRRALGQLQQAYALTPDDPRMLMNLAMAYCHTGHDAEALRCAQLAIGFGYPEDAAPLAFLFAQAATRGGRYAEAACHAAPMLASIAGASAVVDCIYRALESVPLRANAIERLGEFVHRSIDAFSRVSGLAALAVLWFTQLGSVDRAFAVANAAIDVGAQNGFRPLNWQTLWLPELLPMRQDPRFELLVGRLGFARYWCTFGMPDTAPISSKPSAAM